MGATARFLSSGLMLGIAFCPFVTQAQPWKEVAKIRASDASCNDDFGTSVSSYGSAVIVGAPGAGLLGRPGTAYIFRKNDQEWVQEVRLASSDANSGRDFGTAVAIDGDRAAVGDDEWTDRFGVVYVFERNETPPLWQEVRRIQPSDSSFFDHFGASLDLAGETLAVGATSVDDDEGAVYIFDRDHGGAGNWGEVTKFSGSDSQAGDRFGRSVALGSPDRVVVGASTHGEAIEGAAYVFERDPMDPESWIEVTKLIPSGPTNRLGTSVAMDGNMIIVGSWGTEAYIFERNPEGSWQEVTALSGQQSDVFGYSVGINKNFAIVGDNQDDVMGINAGAAYVFGRHTGGVDNWGRTKFFATDATQVDVFGWAAAVNETDIFIGAPSDDDASPSNPNCDSGSVYFGVGPVVFLDGFESGNTIAWSVTAP